MKEVISFSQREHRSPIVIGNLALEHVAVEESAGFGQSDGIIIDFTKRKEELRRKKHEQIRSGLTFNSSTKKYVDFFNTFHKEEGLPQNWQNLQHGKNQVGFSMKGQMELLEGDDPEARRVWAKQTRQDLQGFVIEYLSPYIVYPWHHEKKENPDGTANLVDARYGGKKMVDTVNEDERNGAVKRVIEAIDQAVVEKKVPNGSIFVQWSPMDESPTGLKQDNGGEIVYTDTHLIVSQVNGDRLDGFTIKTDLTKKECAEMIRRLTGKIIPEDAPIKAYINAVALVSPVEGKIASVDDVIRQAADVREDLSFGSRTAYKDKSWDSVMDQVRQGDRLYEYTDRMQAILERFEEDVMRDNPTREELTEYIAATVLRVSQEAQIATISTNQVGSHGGVDRSYNYGDTLKHTAAIQGCAGGGITAIGGMFGVSRAVGGGGGSKEWFNCPKCSYKASGPIGDTCPGCRLTKQDYAKDKPDKEVC